MVFALLGISAAEGIPLLMTYSGWRHLWWLEHLGAGTLLGWLAAAATAALFIAASLRRNPLIREHFFDLSGLKFLAIIMALISGIFEEAFFRRFVMDLLRHFGHGALFQIVLSALIFGAVHGVWAMGGGLRTGVSAAIATGVLGALLAVAYILSGRSVLPCMVAHAAINLALEPWLLLSAFSGQWRATPRLETSEA